MSPSPRPRLTEEASNPATSAERLIELSAHRPLRAIVAGNPAAPAPLLASLAQDVNVRVREAVAGNPNTPWPSLEQLAGEFPQAFLENPIGPLQMLAHPEQISTDEAFWDVVLPGASVPSMWWTWLSKHHVLGALPAVQLHLQYAGEPTPPYRDRRKGGGRDLFTLVLLLTEGYNRGLALPPLPVSTPEGRVVLPCEQLMGEYLRLLARDQHKSVRKLVAEHPLTPPEVLQALAQDPFEDYSSEVPVRTAVAENPRTPPELLRILALDTFNNRLRGAAVRRAVARNPQTPVKLLRALAGDARDDVRAAAALDERLPDEMVRRLAQDAAATVRFDVARRRDLPEEVLRALAQDQHSGVRGNVARRQDVPEEVLLALAGDAHHDVRRDVAYNLRAPAEALYALAQDKDETVRWFVAQNPRTPGEVLRVLAQEQKEVIRMAAARNPQTPEEVLQALARHSDPNTRRSVAENPLAPEEMLCALARDEQIDVRQAVAWNPHTPGEALRALAGDEAQQVRRAVARNPHTPEEVLRALAQDQKRNVRWMANFVLRLCIEDEQKLYEPGWWEQLWRFEELLDDSPAAAPSPKALLEVCSHFDVSESLRQAALTLLAANWSARQIARAFPLPDGSSSGSPMDTIRYLNNRRPNYRLLLGSLPPIALEKLATSPQWDIRYLVALHDQTPWETRQRLCQDANRYVRVMAQAKAAMTPAPAVSLSL